MHLPSIRFCFLVLNLLATEAPAAEPQASDLGSSLQLWAKQSGYHCAHEQAGKTVCRLGSASGLSVQEVPLRGIDLYFEAQQLERICRVFDELDFQPMRERIDSQRGPASNHHELLKAGMGGSFKNEIWVWEENGLVTMLEQFHERIATSSLCVLEQAAFERLMSTRAKRRMRGVRDL